MSKVLGASRVRAKRTPGIGGRWLRGVAMVAAAVVGLSGVAVANPAAAMYGFSTTIEAGWIKSPSSPFKLIVQDVGFRHNIWRDDLYGSSAYTIAGEVHAHGPRVDPGGYDFTSNSTLKADVFGEKSEGGTGTVADPYWLQVQGPAGKGVFVQTQKISYVAGDEYIRIDHTMENTSGNARKIQFGQNGDCDFGYYAPGTNVLDTARQTASCVNRAGEHFSLVGGSPGAMMASGHDIQRAYTNGPFVPTDTCFQGCNGPTNGIGVRWEETLAPYGSSTKTYFETYSADMPAFADLVAVSTVSPGNVSVGDTATYSVSVRNGGPDAARAASAKLVLPAGMTFKSTTASSGSYDRVSGVWSVGNLARGAEATLKVVAEATAVGTHVTRVSEVGSRTLTSALCGGGGGGACGPELTVTVTPETGKAAESTIAAVPTTLSVGDPVGSVVTVQAVDSAGGVMATGGANVTISSTLEGLSATTDNGDGTYSAVLKSEVAGTAVLSFTMNGVASTAKARVTFTPGPVDTISEETGFTVSTGPQSTDGGAHRIEASLVDQFGNAVSLDETALEGLKAFADPDTGVTVGGFREVDGTPGTYMARVGSTVQGEKTVTVKLAGQDVTARGNDIAEFETGGPSTTHADTHFEVTDGTKVAGVDTHTVKLQVADAGGNLVDDLTASAFSFDAVNEDNEVDRSVVVNGFVNRGGGEYSFAVGSKKAGVKTITAYLGANPITLAPSKGATAEFVAGEPAILDPTRVNFTVTGGKKPADEDTHTVTVLVHDQYGNPILNAVPALQWTTNAELGDTGVQGSFAPTVTPGAYTSTVASKRSGVKPIDVTLDEETVSKLPVGGNVNADFVAGVPSAAQSLITAVPGTVQANGVSASGVTVQLRDVNENQILTTPVNTTVTVESSLGDISDTPATAVGNGSYRASLTSTEVGDAAVSFKVNTVPGIRTAEVKFLTVAAPVVLYANATHVVGSAMPGEWISVRDASHGELGRDVVDAKGMFDVLLDPPAAHGAVLTVVAIDANGFVSDGTEVVVDAVPPEAPKVNPSNGNRVTGTAEAASLVKVKGPGGRLLCETTAARDGTFSCVPTPRPNHGDELKVTATDAANNESVATVVKINQVPPAVPVLELSNGRVVDGGVVVAGDRLVFVNEQNRELPGNIGFDSNGRFSFTPDKRLRESDKVRAIVTDPATNSVEVDVKIRTKAPVKPTVNPAPGGDKVTGCADPGSTTTIRDESGNVIATGIAGEDCRFEIELQPKQEQGAKVSVTATDGAGNVSEKTTIYVGSIAMLIAVPAVHPGETQIVHGYGFQPGEKVSMVLESSAAQVGKEVVDAQGHVTFEFVVSVDVENGSHSVTLKGGFSGTTSDTFNVVAKEYEESSERSGLAATGDQSPWLLGAGGALLLGASVFLGMARRRSSLSCE